MFAVIGRLLLRASAAEILIAAALGLTGCTSCEGDRNAAPSARASSVSEAAAATPPLAPPSAPADGGTDGSTIVTSVDAGSSDLAAAARDVDRAQRELTVAKRALSRQKELNAQGEPKSELADAQRAYDRAARDLRQAEERLKVLRAEAHGRESTPDSGVDGG